MRSACSKRDWTAPSPASVLELQMRRTLAAALLIGGQYSRAAQLFERPERFTRLHL